ncbi:hypothetical protein HYH03_001640 [Edaphochlamys debaryana]|uniref:F-box domain-containing protein n=1 Tax=Edaphochlamys debaryana TaxID=47281 RepID=A0A835YDH5_9CHLO|nr:hypothetical protein HYH03_001640 [Edaphochlamys debaryana]|eukprot:KAG2500880.1 hypothetical protein HYH03_001640 [Edaphochlamys debaryana]
MASASARQCPGCRSEFINSGYLWFDNGKAELCCNKRCAVRAQRRLQELRDGTPRSRKPRAHLVWPPPDDVPIEAETGWASLSAEVLSLVGSRLVGLRDRLSAALVCRHWREQLSKGATHARLVMEDCDGPSGGVEAAVGLLDSGRALMPQVRSVDVSVPWRCRGPDSLLRQMHALSRWTQLQSLSVEWDIPAAEASAAEAAAVAATFARYIAEAYYEPSDSLQALLSSMSLKDGRQPAVLSALCLGALGRLTGLRRLCLAARLGGPSDTREEWFGPPGVGAGLYALSALTRLTELELRQPPPAARGVREDWDDDERPVWSPRDADVSALTALRSLTASAEIASPPLLEGLQACSRLTRLVLTDVDASNYERFTDDRDFSWQDLANALGSLTQLRSLRIAFAPQPPYRLDPSSFSARLVNLAGALKDLIGKQAQAQAEAQAQQAQALPGSAQALGQGGQASPRPRPGAGSTPRASLTGGPGDLDDDDTAPAPGPCGPLEIEIDLKPSLPEWPAFPASCLRDTWFERSAWEGPAPEVPRLKLEEEVVEALAGLTVLRHLDLRFTEGNAPNLTRLASLTRLTHLELVCEPNSDTLSLTAGGVRHLLSCWTQLTSLRLDLPADRLAPAALDVLAGCPALTTLDLRAYLHARIVPYGRWEVRQKLLELAAREFGPGPGAESAAGGEEAPPSAAVVAAVDRCLEPLMWLQQAVVAHKWFADDLKHFLDKDARSRRDAAGLGEQGGVGPLGGPPPAELAAEAEAVGGALSNIPLWALLSLDDPDQEPDANAAAAAEWLAGFTSSPAELAELAAAADTAADPAAAKHVPLHEISVEDLAKLSVFLTKHEEVEGPVFRVGAWPPRGLQELKLLGFEGLSFGAASGGAGAGAGGPRLVAMPSLRVLEVLMHKEEACGEAMAAVTEWAAERERAPALEAAVPQAHGAPVHLDDVPIEAETGWASLNAEVLFLVGSRLVGLRDRLSAALVCQHWREQLTKGATHARLVMEDCDAPSGGVEAAVGLLDSGRALMPQVRSVDVSVPWRCRGPDSLLRQMHALSRWTQLQSLSVEWDIPAAEASAAEAAAVAATFARYIAEAYYEPSDSLQALLSSMSLKDGRQPAVLSALCLGALGRLTGLRRLCLAARLGGPSDTREEWFGPPGVGAGLYALSALTRLTELELRQPPPAARGVREDWDDDERPVWSPRDADVSALTALRSLTASAEIASPPLLEGLQACSRLTRLVLTDVDASNYERFTDDRDFSWQDLANALGSLTAPPMPAWSWRTATAPRVRSVDVSVHWRCRGPDSLLRQMHALSRWTQLQSLSVEWDIPAAEASAAEAAAVAATFARYIAEAYYEPSDSLQALLSSMSLKDGRQPAVLSALCLGALGRLTGLRRLCLAARLGGPSDTREEWFGPPGVGAGLYALSALTRVTELELREGPVAARGSRRADRPVWSSRDGDLSALTALRSLTASAEMASPPLLEGLQACSRLTRLVLTDVDAVHYDRSGEDRSNYYTWDDMADALGSLTQLRSLRIAFAPLALYRLYPPSFSMRLVTLAEALKDLIAKQAQAEAQAQQAQAQAPPGSAQMLGQDGQASPRPRPSAGSTPRASLTGGPLPHPEDEGAEPAPGPCGPLEIAIDLRPARPVWPALPPSSSEERWRKRMAWEGAEPKVPRLELEEEVVEALARLTVLRHLDLRFTEGNAPNLTRLASLTRLTHLELICEPNSDTLSLTAGGVRHLLSCWTQLTSLRLDLPADCLAPTALELLPGCPTLTSLDLRTYPRSTFVPYSRWDVRRRLLKLAAREFGPGPGVEAGPAAGGEEAPPSAAVVAAVEACLEPLMWLQQVFLAERSVYEVRSFLWSDAYNRRHEAAADLGEEAGEEPLAGPPAELAAEAEAAGGALSNIPFWALLPLDDPSQEPDANAAAAAVWLAGFTSTPAELAELEAAAAKAADPAAAPHMPLHEMGEEYLYDLAYLLTESVEAEGPVFRVGAWAPRGLQELKLLDFRGLSFSAASGGTSAGAGVGAGAGGGGGGSGLVAMPALRRLAVIIHKEEACGEAMAAVMDWAAERERAPALEAAVVRGFIWGDHDWVGS